jgi:hypothetical protein
VVGDFVAQTLFAALGENRLALDPELLGKLVDSNTFSQTDLLELQNTPVFTPKTAAPLEHPRSEIRFSFNLADSSADFSAKATARQLLRSNDQQG